MPAELVASALIAAAVSAVVTLALDYFARPALELRRQRYLDRQRTLDDLRNTMRYAWGVLEVTPLFPASFFRDADTADRVRLQLDAARDEFNLAAHGYRHLGGRTFPKVISDAISTAIPATTAALANANRDLDQRPLDVQEINEVADRLLLLLDWLDSPKHHLRRRRRATRRLHRLNAEDHENQPEISYVAGAAYLERSARRAQRWEALKRPPLPGAKPPGS